MINPDICLANSKSSDPYAERFEDWNGLACVFALSKASPKDQPRSHENVDPYMLCGEMRAKCGNWLEQATWHVGTL